MNFLLLCNKLPQTQQLETTDIHNHPASGVWEQPGWVLLFSLCPRVGHSRGRWVEASVLTTWPPHRPPATWELTFPWEQVVEREREGGQAGKCGGLAPGLGAPTASASAGTSLLHCGSGLPGTLRTISLLGH